ncbi:hypothetical protein TPY_2036 [Sulfobacillus acidophilus TPY]|uniref:Uncharacterized protein n=1 Tax=Sulfobacillus acidophilus (strain ATCC 700253 / DSM 10332 / NAL) TaxID=679936 RepID=G8TTN2_SULAD|nr:hypothetical protein TPY_2036 [Sulfobacillus acidophilus TPY]AEW05698.1 hypothetical protein Sulac_2223 [Sulfobacillus acidophilus DSM 10332]
MAIKIPKLLTAVGAVTAMLVASSDAVAKSFSLDPYPVYRVMGHPTVYIERNGVMQAILTKAEFFDLGFRWSDVRVVSQLPDPVGSSAQLFRQSGQSAVYWYNGGQLHWIPSPAVFQAMRFQWDDVYTVSQLPWPVGSPVAQPTNPPAALEFLSGYPYLPAEAGQSKSFALYALTSSGQVMTEDNGSATVTLTNNSAGVSLGTTATSEPVTFHNGVAWVTVTAGSGAVGTSATLSASAPGVAQPASLTVTLLSANPAQQTGYRVFWPSGTPLGGGHPLSLSTYSTSLQIDSVNAWGQPVPATVGDTADTDLVNGSNNGQVFNTAVYIPVGQTSEPLTYQQEFQSPDDAPGGVGPAVILAKAGMPQSAAVVSMTNVTTGQTLSVSDPVAHNNGEVFYSQSVNGVQTGATYQVAVNLYAPDRHRIQGNPFAVFVPAEWDIVTPDNLQWFEDGLSGFPGNANPPTVTGAVWKQNQLTFTYTAGGASPTGDTLWLTVETYPGFLASDNGPTSPFFQTNMVPVTTELNTNSY